MKLLPAISFFILLASCTNLRYGDATGARFSYTSVMQNSSLEQLANPEGKVLLTRTGVDNAPATEALSQIVRLKVWESILSSVNSAVDSAETISTE